MKENQNCLGRKLHLSFSRPLCSAQLACSQWMLKTNFYTLLLYYLHYYVTKFVHRVLTMYKSYWQYNTCIDKRVLRGFCLQL